MKNLIFDELNGEWQKKRTDWIELSFAFGIWIAGIILSILLLASIL